MEKITADILINGNLICKIMLTGGGEIHPCRKEKLNEYFNVKDAVHIIGDVVVDSFDSKERTVVVTGSVASQGGGYGEQ